MGRPPWFLTMFVQNIFTTVPSYRPREVKTGLLPANLQYFLERLITLIIRQTSYVVFGHIVVFSVFSFLQCFGVLSPFGPWDTPFDVSGSLRDDGLKHLFSTLGSGWFPSLRLCSETVISILRFLFTHTLFKLVGLLLLFLSTKRLFFFLERVLSIGSRSEVYPNTRYGDDKNTRSFRVHFFNFTNVYLSPILKHQGSPFIVFVCV